MKNIFTPFFDKSERIGLGMGVSQSPDKNHGMNEQLGTIHFIGIGGIGMSGIAEVLLNLGYKVSGSDKKKSPITKRLEKLGARVYYEHEKENVHGCSVVVFSAAVPMTNPEIREAKQTKIPVIPRAEMLNELVRMKKGIGIAGTHGKTTTTGMLSLVLKEGGFDPTMLIGGVLDSLGSNAHLGHGDYLVFEACEAYNSIEYFLPEISVLLNVDKDHMESYNNFDELKQTFRHFLNKVPFYSFCVANIDDDNVKEILHDLSKKVITFGFSENADVSAYGLKFDGMNTKFQVKSFGEELGEFTLRIPGKHNVMNALSVIATSVAVGVSIDKIKSALSKFVNSERRFQILYDKDEILIIDDYAHHPNEIQATLQAARQISKNDDSRRLVAIFQPHLYSRTQMHFEEFAQSLKLADKVFLTPIYPAREKPIPGVTTTLIYDLLKEESVELECVDDLADVPDKIMNQIQKGDIVITLGAGDITKVGHEIVNLLK